MTDAKKINLTEMHETLTAVGRAFQQKAEELRPVFDLIIEGIKFFAE